MTILGLFEVARKIDRSLGTRTPLIAIITFASPFLVLSVAGIRLNSSPSLPLGFYRETSDQHASLVEFCPEEPYARFAAERGYRAAGNCPDGAGPLMKPLIARQGDVVDVGESGIAVNGRMVPNTAPKKRDSRGRPMHPWPEGHYTVPTGFVWVASSYNEWSFDSRYFGPVRTGIIRRRLKPFLTL